MLQRQCKKGNVQEVTGGLLSLGGLGGLSKEVGLSWASYQEKELTMHKRNQGPAEGTAGARPHGACGELLVISGIQVQTEDQRAKP